MIIEARGDVVTLEGVLSENHWDAIAAAVDLVLPEHPEGILMDCSDLQGMTEMGGATFMDGLSYMDARGARIILCNLPRVLQEQLRSIPGLQSQVPIADTLGQGRQSLNTAQARPLSRQANKRVVLAPVNPPFSAPAVVRLLRPSVVEAGAEVHIVYVILVPRALPVGAPMPEQEARANEALCEVDSLISGIGAVRHVVRGRNIADGVLDAADRLGAAEVLVGLDDSARADDAVESILAALREKCTCILTMTQQPLAPAGATTQAQLQGTAAR